MPRTPSVLITFSTEKRQLYNGQVLDIVLNSSSLTLSCSNQTYVALDDVLNESKLHI